MVQRFYDNQTKKNEQTIIRKQFSTSATSVEYPPLIFFPFNHLWGPTAADLPSSPSVWQWDRSSPGYHWEDFWHCWWWCFSLYVLPGRFCCISCKSLLTYSVIGPWHNAALKYHYSLQKACQK